MLKHEEKEFHPCDKPKIIRTDVEQDMSIITHITKDHDEAKSFYREYTKFRASNNYHDATKWYNQLIWEIARHSVAEELVLYPFLEEQKFGDVAENLREHQEVKENLAKLEKMNIQDIEFDKLLRLTMTSLEEHMAREENDELPLLSKSVARDRLDLLGIQFYKFSDILLMNAISLLNLSLFFCTSFLNNFYANTI